ncbi:H-NS family nucleoid-associated regulatory protein [Thioflexithrix psekupsensis]|uniref:DNA-binding protein H-NS-like C-terminal domain-containing protein n=1 Tax=Thioflexithrix psekupsensis TaxID=1570016 RepID=A0A251X3Y3_9GAMM|nr:H-NS histone family protein [Thioflexithrix psekupsensis]OUD12065.1 hypothetical protein TPSD3_13085 [Thioflexithrix psekupsensis]
MQNQIEAKLSTLSLTELLEVQQRIKGLIHLRRRSQQKVLESQMREMARAQGLELEDVVLRDKEGARRSRKTASAQYRNPNNPLETWTGLGKRPNWLKAYLANGGSLETLKIVNA